MAGWCHQAAKIARGSGAFGAVLSLTWAFMAFIAFIAAMAFIGLRADKSNRANKHDRVKRVITGL